MFTLRYGYRGTSVPASVTWLIDWLSSVSKQQLIHRITSLSVKPTCHAHYTDEKWLLKTWQIQLTLYPQVREPSTSESFYESIQAKMFIKRTNKQHLLTNNNICLVPQHRYNYHHRDTILTEQTNRAQMVYDICVTEGRVKLVSDSLQQIQQV